MELQDEGPDAVAADGMVDCRLLTEKLEWSPCVKWFHNDPARDGLETHSEHRQRSRSAVTDVHLPGDAAPAAVAAQDGSESAEDRADRLARERAERQRNRTRPTSVNAARSSPSTSWV